MEGNNASALQKGIFRKKPINPEDFKSSGGLARVLSLRSLIFFGVGGIVGTGLFAITGVAASVNAGPSVTLAYLISAIACAFVGLCYGELSSIVPAAGSSYTYTYVTLGEFIAWIVGWNLVLEYSVGAATVAVSWSGYVASLLHDLGLSFPPRLMASPFETLTLADGSKVSGIVNLPAAFIIIVISLFLMRGVKESLKVNDVVVFVKLFVIITVITVSIPYIKWENYTPFIPPNTGTFGHFGWSGVMQAAGTIFFAYIGFDAVSATAQEAKKPSRDIPLSILIILAVCAVIYIAFSFVLVGVVNFHDLLNDSAPVATAIDKTAFPWLKIVVKFSIIFGYVSVLFLLLIGQTRIFFAMSRDGLLPPFFSKVHPTYHTPWPSHIFFMFAIAILCAFLPIAQLAHMCSIGTLLAFILVCIEVMILRKTHPNEPRKFRIPGGNLIPILGTITCIAIMYSLDSLTWFSMFTWMLIGLVFYFSYSRKHSHLHKKHF